LDGSRDWRQPASSSSPRTRRTLASSARPARFCCPKPGLDDEGRSDEFVSRALLRIHTCLRLHRHVQSALASSRMIFGNRASNRLISRLGRTPLLKLSADSPLADFLTNATPPNLFPAYYEERIVALLDDIGVPGYSRTPDVVGRGPREQHFNNQIWPGVAWNPWSARPGVAVPGVALA
jgi:hypothetical protein